MRRGYSRKRSYSMRAAVGGYRKKRGIVRTYRKTIREQMIHTKHTFDDTTVSELINNALPASEDDYKFASTFYINDLPEVSVYRNMFDYYRINKVVFEIIPSISQIDAADTSWQVTPTASVKNIIKQTGFIGTVIDYSNAVADLTPPVARASQHYKETTLTQRHVRVFTPAVLSYTYEGVGSDAFRPKFKQWIRSVDFPYHYGIRGIIYKRYSKVTPSVNVRCTYYISWKSVSPNSLSAVCGQTMAEVVSDLQKKKEKGILRGDYYESVDDKEAEPSDAETEEADYDAWIEASEEKKQREEKKMEINKENKEQVVVANLEAMALDKPGPVLKRTLGIPRRSLGLSAPLSRSSSLASQQGKAPSSKE